MKQLHLLVPFTLPLSCFLLLACAPAKKQFAGGTAQSSTSRDIAADLEAQVPSEAQKEAVAALPFEKVYTLIRSQLSDAALTIDGLTIEGLASQIQELEPAFEALQDRYGSIGEYLKAQGAVPQKMTEARAHKALVKVYELNQRGPGWKALIELMKSPKSQEMEPSALVFELQTTPTPVQEPADPRAPYCQQLQESGLTSTTDVNASLACLYNLGVEADNTGEEIDTEPGVGQGANNAAAVSLHKPGRTTLICGGLLAATVGQGAAQFFHESNCP